MVSEKTYFGVTSCSFYAKFGNNFDKLQRIGITIRCYALM